MTPARERSTRDIVVTTPAAASRTAGRPEPAGSVHVARRLVDVAERARHSRRWSLTGGLLTASTGLVVLVAPGSTVPGVAIAVGVGLVALVVLAVARGVAGDDPLTRRVRVAALGTVGVALGVLSLTTPEVGILVLVLAVAAWFAVSGADDLVHAVTSREGRPGRVFTGLTSLVPAVLLFANVFVVLGLRR